MKTCTLAILSLLLTIAVVPVASRESRNRNLWARDGFYGFPVKAAAVDSSGTPETLIVTDSARQPRPTPIEQWRYAASEVYSKFVRHFLP